MITPACVWRNGWQGAWGEGLRNIAPITRGLATSRLRTLPRIVNWNRHQSSVIHPILFQSWPSKILPWVILTALMFKLLRKPYFSVPLLGFIILPFNRVTKLLYIRNSPKREVHLPVQVNPTPASYHHLVSIPQKKRNNKSSHFVFMWHPRNSWLALDTTRRPRGPTRATSC